MANTAPFSIVDSLNAANTFLANTTSVQSLRFLCNSSTLAITGNLAVAQNTYANIVQSNTQVFANVTSNQVFVNTVSGNNQTLINCTSNQIFVNSVSSVNVGNFKSVTSNQIFVNTISGNICTILSSFSGTLSSNIFHVGNSTVYSELQKDGLYFSDDNNAYRHMPAEVVLQSGSSSGASFTINFSTEVTSGLFKSMKLIVSNLKLSGSANVALRFSSDGTTILSGASYSYYQAFAGTDGLSGDSDHNTGATMGIMGKQTSSGSGGFEAIFPDTTLNSGIKTAYGNFVMHATTGTGNPSPWATYWGIIYSSAITLKGVQVLLNTGTISSCSWVLIGRRY